MKLWKYCSTIHIRRIDPENPEKVLTKSCYAKKEIQYKFEVNEAINPVKNYQTMIRDEKAFPNFRFYNPEANFDNILDVYCYYFYDCKNAVKQRLETLHIAMDLFTQCIMKISTMSYEELDSYGCNFANISKDRFGFNYILVSTWLLISSKFNEIDYNLPSFEYLKHWEKLRHFWQGIQWRDYVEFERFVVKLLNWNLNKITPYHFLQCLIAQGIVLSHEKIRVTKEKGDNQEESDKESSNVWSNNLKFNLFSDYQTAIWRKKSKYEKE